MTTKREYDKKTLIILRAVLIVIGAGVGGLALWQYFVYYPDVVRNEFKILIAVVSSVLLATLLALSAKPVYRLGSGIKEYAVGIKSKLGMKGIASVVLGFTAAVAVAIVVDVVMSTYQNIWAVRLLVDILAYIGASALFCAGFIKWLSAAETSEDSVAVKNRGYLISYKCLADERATVAADTLINVYVCDIAYKALCLFGGDAEAIKRLDSLVNSGAVKLLHVKTQFTEAHEADGIEKAFAASKRLKYLSTDDCDVNIEVFK